MCMMFIVIFVVHVTWYLMGLMYLRRHQSMTKQKDRKLLRIKHLGKLINESDKIYESTLNG